MGMAPWLFSYPLNSKTFDDVGATEQLPMITRTARNCEWNEYTCKHFQKFSLDVLQWELIFCSIYLKNKLKKRSTTWIFRTVSGRKNKIQCCLFWVIRTATAIMSFSLSACHFYFSPTYRTKLTKIAPSFWR